MKAILVLEMPSRCLNCNCVGHVNHNGKFNVCRISGEILKEDDYYNQRPNHCPLREVPQKKTIHCTDTPHHRWAKNGYNACIDEILGDKEQ